MTTIKNNFYNNILTRCFLTISAVLILLAYTRQALCSSTDTAKDVFAPITKLSGHQRIVDAYTIYKQHYRKATREEAMHALDQLNALAIELDDMELQCDVFDMRADNYSVNTGYNKTSTAYYQQAIDFAVENKMPLQTGIALNNMGNYLFIYKQYVQACQYFLRSEEEFKEIGYQNVPEVTSYLNHIIDFYYSLGDYENARIVLEDALKYVQPNTRQQINIINTLGLIYRNYKQYTPALTHFNQALQIASATKDSVWMAIAKGNIGSVYFMQNKYDKALPYIETDYQASIKNDDPLNGVIALLRLVKINLDEKQFSKAGQELQTAMGLLSNSKNDVLQYWAQYNDLKAEYDEDRGDDKQSLSDRKAYEKEKDSLIKRDNLAAIERVQLRYEADKRTAELDKLQANERIEAIVINASVAIFALVVVILILIYNRQRLAAERDKKLLLAEKKILDEQLKSADKDLKTFTENLRQKNILIDNFKVEVDRLTRETSGKVNDEHLEELMNAHIMTDENWNDFKKLFSKVYPGFFVNLSNNYPQLSSTDTRILALIKLGLNNNEMAAMLGITVEGIKKAKQRLRKKVDLHLMEELWDLS